MEHAKIAPSHSQAIAELTQLLGDRLQTSAAALKVHGANEAQFPEALPDAVAFPRSTEEVSAIMRICSAHTCPVTAHGAGSSLEGHHLPVQGGISLDMGQMDKIVEVVPEDMLAVVQPGVTREALNDDLRATGLFFSVDPGANASLGGMAATRASGTTAVRYGTMRENVLALEAVLADGRVIRTGTRARKSSAGYDLTHLLVGSEGTLAVITELTLRLYGQPEAISAATCRFSTVEACVETVIATVQIGIPMARIEFLDDQMVRGFNRYAKADLPETPHLLVEFHGSASGVAEQAETFGEIANEFGAEGFEWADTTEKRKELWRMRHSAHYAVRELRPGFRALSTDVCVPVSRLAEAITHARGEVDRLGLTCAMLGHVGDGNFHCGVLVDPDDAQEVANVAAFSEGMARQALALGGTVTGEHGIGLGKRKYMRAEHGDAVDTMQTLKTAMDPAGILNPGKLLPE